MMNFKGYTQSDKIINSVLELLDEAYLEKTIDEPVQRAAAEFNYQSLDTHEYFRFVDITTHFFGHIYSKVGIFKRNLSLKQVQEELIGLLDERYIPPKENGFYMAYLDAIEEPEPVLSTITSIIIAHFRDRQVRYVYCKWLAGLNWSEKCLIVNMLFDRIHYLPTNLKQLPPAQLANNIFVLLSAIALADSTVRNLLTGDVVLMTE